MRLRSRGADQGPNLLLRESDDGPGRAMLLLPDAKADFV
jgi:hypothetical protein